MNWSKPHFGLTHLYKWGGTFHATVETYESFSEWGIFNWNTYRWVVENKIERGKKHQNIAKQKAEKRLKEIMGERD